MSLDSYGPYSIGSHLEELSKIALKWNFTRIKVLVTIRRQDSRLASGYAQLSNRIRGASQSNFEYWVYYLLQHPFGYYRGGGVKLDYNLLWKRLNRAIGNQNILFLPFELLEKDSSEFLRRWFDFLGIQKEGERIVDNLNERSNCIKTNVRSKSNHKWVLQKGNYRNLRLRPELVVKKFGLPMNLNIHLPDFAREKEIYLTPKLRQDILDVYKESNKILDTAINNIDLGTYGYYLDP